MPAVAPSQARGLKDVGPHAGSRDLRIRAALRLGFFAALAAGGCAGPSPQALARAADARYHTGAFSWLLTHRPAALVAWHVDARDVRAIVPQSRVAAAAAEPCTQAKAGHAALLVVARAGITRNRALDCGLALDKDAGALVVAPL